MSDGQGNDDREGHAAARIYSHVHRLPPARSGFGAGSVAIGRRPREDRRGRGAGGVDSRSGELHRCGGAVECVRAGIQAARRFDRASRFLVPNQTVKR
jgi:hypothetical protein